MRMRKKKNLSSRMDACGALLVQNPAAEKGRWRAHKPDAALLLQLLQAGVDGLLAEREVFAQLSLCNRLLEFLQCV